MKRPIIVIITLALISAVSCQKTGTYDIENQHIDDGRVVFTQSTITKSVKSNWSTDDRIGVYMVPMTIEYEDEIIEFVPPPLEQSISSNVQFVWGSENFSAVGSPLYYPQSGDSVYFVACYPYSSSVDSEFNYSLDFSTKSTDFMVGFSKFLNKQTPNADLTFKHKLSRITINLNLSSYGEAVTTIEAYLTNVYTKGKYNLNTLTMNFDGETRKSLGVNLPIISNSRVEEIILPQSVAESEITLYINDGVSFTTSLPDLEFISGESYNYEITYNKLYGISIDRANIEAWDNGIDNGYGETD